MKNGSDGWGISHKFARVVGVLAVAAIVMTACGDDDDGRAQTAAPTDPGAAVGGEVTILLQNEIAALDPARATAAGSSDGHRMFPLYGALVGYSVERNEVDPIIAESLTPTPDGRVWNLVIREGVRFSDGTDFDAAAVQAHWERIQNPETGSPAFSVAQGIADLEATGPLELRITLRESNAHFDKAVSRTALNYVPSAEAVASGHDLTSDPVGAGPFLLEQWIRDDRMVLVRNPDWFDAPRPYLDRITFRTVLDRQQRVDTLAVGDAHGAYLDGADVTLQGAASIGGEYFSVSTPGAPALTLNVNVEPLNDPRVRRAIAHAIDRDAITEIVHGSQFEGADNFAMAGSPWHFPEGALPDYDPDAAQELIDQVVAETGGPVEIEIGGFTGSAGDPERMRFVQTSLNQLDGVVATVDLADAGTAYGRVLQREYQVHSWGFPFYDPEPGLWNAVHSEQATNYSGYANPAVDQALEAARLTRDHDERVELYRTVFAELAADLPFLPLTHAQFGFVLWPEIQGAQFYEDILRLDLIWLAS